MTSVLKPWLILAIIFVAGGLTGSAVTLALSGHLTHPPGAPPGPPDDIQKMWMLRLIHQLNLTADQQAKIEPIVRDTAAQVQKIHRQEFGQVRDILKASDDQIAALLTPDQQTELKKMIDEREKAFSRHQRQWGSPHDGPDGMHFHGGPDTGPPAPPNPPPPAPPATNAPAQ